MDSFLHRIIYCSLERIKRKLNQYLKIDKIVKHACFDLFMTLVVITNTSTLLIKKDLFNLIPLTWQVILIVEITASGDTNVDGLLLADKILLYIYVGEIGLKMVALGIRNYFYDNWNKYG